MRWLIRLRPGAAPQRRTPRQRLRRRLLFAGAAAAMAASAIGVGASALRSGRMAAAVDHDEMALAALAARGGFAVDHVAVEGRERTRRAAILAALNVHLGTPILDVDLGAAKTRLQSLTWVESADVERELPNTIFVHLVERRPLAFWQRNNKLSLIDTNGKVIPTDQLDRFGPLIVLVGNDVPQQAAGLLAMLAQEPKLYAEVTAAVHVGGRRWNIKLNNGIEVALPEEHPGAAWRHLAALDQKDQLLERAILEVDMRLPDRLVLRLPPAPKPERGRKLKGGKTT